MGTWRAPTLPLTISQSSPMSRLRIDATSPTLAPQSSITRSNARSRDDSAAPINRSISSGVRTRGRYRRRGIGSRLSAGFGIPWWRPHQRKKVLMHFNRSLLLSRDIDVSPKTGNRPNPSTGYSGQCTASLLSAHAYWTTVECASPLALGSKRNWSIKSDVCIGHYLRHIGLQLICLDSDDIRLHKKGAYCFLLGDWVFRFTYALFSDFKGPTSVRHIRKFVIPANILFAQKPTPTFDLPTLLS